jgi:hypothetical protein
MSVAETLIDRAMSHDQFIAFRTAFERAGVQSWLKPNEMALHFHEALEKFDENSGVNSTFFLDHETHVAARRDSRDQAHAVTRSRA